MFILEYIKNPKGIGAIAPSSGHLANKMISEIDFEKANYIIEYGPGTGVFTEKILARVKDNTVLILIEVNEGFCDILRGLYGHKKNVIIVNDSAEHIDMILKNYNINNIDYIISGLPFSSLPKKVSNRILKKTADMIKDEGEFITFQYTLFKLNFIKKFFERINYERVFINLPPAYVLKCKGDNYREAN